MTHAKDLQIDHPDEELGNDNSTDNNNKEIFEIYDDSDLNGNKNKETNLVSDSESDDCNNINEDVTIEHRLTQIEKINMNTSIKLAKINDNAVYHSPDRNRWDKTIVIGRAGKAIDQNKNWFNVKNMDRGNLLV